MKDGPSEMRIKLLQFGSNIDQESINVFKKCSVILQLFSAWTYLKAYRVTEMNKFIIIKLTKY
jgi:hypothetical protein